MANDYSPAIRKLLAKNKTGIGGRIAARRGKGLFEGLLMPSSEPDTLVLKLDSGYNVGIKFGKGVGIKKSESPEPAKIKEEEKFELGGHVKTSEQTADKSKPSISILHTGGTIASRVDYRTGGVVSSFSPEDLLAMFPELSQMANIRTRLVFSIMSESLRFSDYQALAKEIAKEIENGADGVIVAHGTDTMHYTSAALAFMLQNLPVPVILVGAQRSSDRGSTDAAQNLTSAAYFIAHSDFAGAAICMHENAGDGNCLILPAAKSRKMHTSRRDAFRPINSLPWARVSYAERKIEFLKNDYLKKDKKMKAVMKMKMEEKVALIKTTVNMDPALIDFFIGKKYKGLILEGTGLGHAPDNLLIRLKKAAEKGMVVCMASQTIYGRVDMNVYSPQRDLLKIGVIPCGDMLPETAFIKLAWLLGNFPKKAGELMGKNICGELSERTDVEEFLN
ncbi:MAG: Glu-tRNA(Gln) amidotransferase subunit GatD [Candidatus Aenigmatarchaeota archaeon]